MHFVATLLSFVYIFDGDFGTLCSGYFVAILLLCCNFSFEADLSTMNSGYFVVATEFLFCCMFWKETSVPQTVPQLQVAEFDKRLAEADSYLSILIDQVQVFVVPDA